MTDPPPWISGTLNATVLHLYVQPGARRTAIVGCHGRWLKIAVAAQAQDGQANAALLAFLAQRLALRRDALRVTSGQSARVKRVTISGAIEPAAIIAALSGG